MPINPEYHKFLDHINGKKEDSLDRDLEVPASDKEIGWWKREQVRKAIRATRYGIATPAQIELLNKHRIPYAWRAKKRTFAEMEKKHQS